MMDPARNSRRCAVMVELGGRTDRTPGGGNWSTWLAAACDPARSAVSRRGNEYPVPSYFARAGMLTIVGTDRRRDSEGSSPKSRR